MSKWLFIGNSKRNETSVESIHVEMQISILNKTCDCDMRLEFERQLKEEEIKS